MDTPALPTRYFNSSFALLLSSAKFHVYSNSSLLTDSESEKSSSFISSSYEKYPISSFLSAKFEEG